MFHDMTITKREIIASIVIISIMLIFGFSISTRIADYEEKRNAEYSKAIHIHNTKDFRYCMDTNVGNAFVYGDLEAIDYVGFDEIDGQYMYVEKVEEHYTRHTRTVTKTRTNSDGEEETYEEEEEYYTWDYYDSWSKHSKNIKFCGVKFPYGKINEPSEKYIKTIDENFYIRYVYYGTDIKFTGTIYTELKDGTISNKSKFFNKLTSQEAYEASISFSAIPIFWVSWVILIIVIVFGFYYFDNRWLED